jgi:hypothetical protein
MRITQTLVILLVIFFTIALFGCASNRLTRKGVKMEQAGIYDHAADYYYQAYLKKNTNIEARLGLQRTGQMVLDRKLSDFNKAYNQGKNEEAVYHYLESEKYYNKIKNTGIDLNFPSYYTDYYNEVKDIYLDDKYIEALNLLQAEKFSQAENILREIVELQPNYKDAAEQLKIAIYEPLYRQSMQDMEIGKYRSAYYGFDNIVSKFGDYKESIDLRAECLEKAIVNITIAPIEIKVNNTYLASTLESKIISEIKTLGNPFLRLVSFDPATTRIKSTNTINVELQASAIGKPQVADVVLNIIVSLYNIEKGALNKEEKKGYLRKEKRVKDSEGNVRVTTEYDKVTYDEYKMGRAVKIAYEYKLIDNRTGELYFADSKSLINSDNIHYVEFTGNAKDLVPGYWKYKRLSSSEDVVKDNRNDVAALQALLGARKVIKTVGTLENEIQASVALQIANIVDEFNPEK